MIVSAFNTGIHSFLGSLALEANVARLVGGAVEKSLVASRVQKAR
jgi:uncharacterized protein YqfA (UPF0365 family)